jgi:WhiB family redox-sensing transcriptional regulator
MTVSAPAVRPRVLAELAARPGQTAYEVAAALGYRKPESRRVAEIVTRLYRRGVLVAVLRHRPALGRQVRVFFIAPPGTRPPSPPQRKRSAAEAENRRRRNRVNQRNRRARAAGKTPGPMEATRPHLRLPKPPGAWQLAAAPACQGADPGLFFPEDGESGAAAKAICARCPVAAACLAAAAARHEPWGIWGGVNFETERHLARSA